MPMGFNTVAVLYNDANFDRPDMGERIQKAMRGWSVRDRFPMETHFGAGIVISQAHADYTQVVAVGRNTGGPISELTTDLDWFALEQLKACLENHGYKVTKPRRKRAA
jgi:hypothetical protein